MVINYIDPGLFKFGGHHPDYAIKILRELMLESMHKVRVFAGANIEPDLVDALKAKAEVVPYFRFFPYRNLRRLDPASGEMSFLMAGVHTFAQELSRLPKADMWLIPTLFDYQLLAIGLIKPNVEVRCVCHFPPWQRGSKLGEQAWRSAGLTLRGRKNVKLFSTIPELAQIFTKLMELKVAPLPLFFDPVAKPVIPRKTIRRIGFFGQQRPQKGLHLLGPVITNLLKKGYEVICQDSSGKLSAENTRGQLTIIGYVSDMADVLKAVDLSVLPYNPDIYRNMLSGIAVESLAVGVPILAPDGVACANFAQHHNAGATFQEYTADSIVLGVENAREKAVELFGGAHQLAQNLAANHGVSAFTRELINS